MVGLPWQWVGPVHESDSSGNEWWEIRVRELPDFFVAAPTRKAAIAEVGTALEAFLESYAAHGELPPLPAVFGDRRDVAEEYGARLGILQLA
jgi:predicted RNase H-like HicB family nuclease